MPPIDEFMATSNVGIDAIRQGLKEKRAFTKDAKLFCSRCNKQETSARPLQSCSRCRSVRYCSRDCQVAHYSQVHKKACANFQDPPLCRAFSTKIALPGCSYPESPVFGLGVSEAMGAWVSIGGSIDCRLATLPGGIKGRPPKDESLSVSKLMAMVPGMMDGKYLALRIMVQNRAPKAKPMVVVGKAIGAFASAKGTPLFLAGKEPGEINAMVDYPHLGRVMGLAKVSAEITHFNGKEIKEAASCSAVKDADMCAVLLNVGDYAMFNIEFRAGARGITHDFQALELLAHVLVPAIPYDPDATESYAKLLPRAADLDQVCEIRAVIDQDSVGAWYKDYKTQGESAYIASHYGEARANMIGAGNQQMQEMLQMMMQMGLNSQ
ncbi:hypothetical protein FB45DRAFT_784449 [Roridomyces roridus]|uniref:MYND-type domain-containing protein n=1 Tax=Roridomyces roridus TaxID=1738132 RepID=A0AAD7CBR2_9AGAR|nr:hypothetical protein FB45DRAFT_784449 [Roridomyces roridus]